MLRKFDYAIIVQLLCNFAGGVRLMNAIKVVKETTHPVEQTKSTKQTK